MYFFSKVFRQPTKHSGKPTIQKKTKENQTNLRENQQNKVFKGFRPTLGYVSFFLVFPKVFKTSTTTFWKTNNTKDNQRKQNKLRENQKNKVFKGFRPTLGFFLFFYRFSRRIFVCFVFPKVFFVFLKTFGKTKQQRKQQTHIQGWV